MVLNVDQRASSHGFHPELPVHRRHHFAVSVNACAFFLLNLSDDLLKTEHVAWLDPTSFKQHQPLDCLDLQAVLAYRELILLFDRNICFDMKRHRPHQKKNLCFGPDVKNYLSWHDRVLAELSVEVGEFLDVPPLGEW